MALGRYALKKKSRYLQSTRRRASEIAASWPAGPFGSDRQLRSGMGLVSRVTPVHTAMRNCTRDEGRSFEVGNQVLISSHRKLLSSKAMVVNVVEKSEQHSDRHD